MDTRTDWHNLIDAAITDPPPAWDQDAVLRQGQRALRRRRTTVASALAVAAIATGGLGWTALPGADPAPHREASVASESSPPPEPTAPAEPSLAPLAEGPGDVREARSPFPGGEAVRSLKDGSLVHRPGWRVTTLEVMESSESVRAWGVAAEPRGGGTGQWLVVTWAPDTQHVISDPAGKSHATFEEWLADTWTMSQGGTAEVVATYVDGQVRPEKGVTVLEVVENPQQAAAYAPIGEVAAAKLRLPDGSLVFAVVRTEDALTVDPSELKAPTMEAFLAHLKARADSGEGVR